MPGLFLTFPGKAQRMRSILLLIVLLGGSLSAGHPTDSPLTSTPIWQAYQDIPLVMRARETRVLDDDMIKFIRKRRNPLDQKAAIINALGWDGGGNVDRYRIHLAGRYKIAEFGPDSRMKPWEKLMLAYLMMLEDYFHPKNAGPYLDNALAYLSDQHTAQLILTLYEAQVAFDNSWCQVWREYESFESDWSEADPKELEVRPEAIGIVRDYLGLYQSSCNS